MPEHLPARLLFMSEAPEAGSLVGSLEALGSSVRLVTSLPECLTMLRKERFDLLLIEDALVALDSPALDALDEACEGALLIELNFATCNQARMVHAVKSALTRQAHFQERATQMAADTLRDDLGAAVAGLLLQTQLLLAHRDHPAPEALEQIAALAQALGDRLRATEDVAAGTICIS